MTNVEIANRESLGVRSPFPHRALCWGGLAIERIVPPGERLFPQIIESMMASLIKDPFDSPDWIFETKLNGFRIIAVIDSAGKARIWSRNHLPLEPKFPTVGDAVNQLNLRSTILDR